jgi:hypothetical protein
MPKQAKKEEAPIPTPLGTDIPSSSKQSRGEKVLFIGL